MRNQWGVADEASLACQPLTSYSMAWFLTGCRLVLVPGGLGTPGLKNSKNKDVTSRAL